MVNRGTEVTDLDGMLPTVFLTDLHEDVVTHILMFSHDVSDIAAFSASSKHFALVANSNELWRQLVAARWPLLPKAEVAAAPMNWREFYRERSVLVPSWRYFLVRMDEVEHLMASLANSSEADCDQLATCLLAVLCSSESRALPGLECPPVTRWASRLCHLLSEASVQQSVGKWTSAILAQLDDFYDPLRVRATLQLTLLRALRCASALALLRNEVVSLGGVVHENGKPLVGDILGGVGPERVQEALQSLEMEGFDVSVPPSLRPARLPRTHAWWHAQTRQGYLGGVTNIR